MSAAAPRSRLRPGDVLGVGLIGVRARRGRATLTAAGIALGIAAMVAVIGISTSSRAELLATLDRLGTDLLVAEPGQTFLGEDATLPEEATAMVGRIGPVTGVAATAPVEATVRRSDLVPAAETRGITVLAAEADLRSTLGGTLAAGRWFDDATASLPVVVLGATAAERLGIDDLEGQPLVWLGERWMAVAGILDPLPLAPELDTAALVGWPYALEEMGLEGDPGRLYVRTTPEQADAVRGVLPATADPEAPEEVAVSRPSDALEARAAADQAFTALLLGLGGVALLVGGVGIANVMVIAVLERRTEIGVRRALGATRGHIRLQFLVEAVLLAALGGAAGALLGSAITAAYATSRGWPVAVPLAGLAAGIAAALAIGALAGLYPAARAARLAPADAVRPA